MNVAFIPVRGGSKSIPLKNIKLICGKPLVYWTIKAACACEYIDKVYIATDNIKIRETVEQFKNEEDAICSKVVVIERSAESASDNASTEYAMLEFAEKYEFDNIVLIQATSPLLKSSDLSKGFEVFAEKETDSVLSVVRQKRFLWKNNVNGFAYATNYDIFNRPRRQDFDGYMVENGAFYISSKDGLINSQNRISGNIKAVEMEEDTFFEIDEPDDWVIVEALMKENGMDTYNNSLTIPEIKIFLTDCDGVLTDGGMYYSENGDELKKFNTRDGMAFKLLKEKGIITGIITGENVELNKRRAHKLKLDMLVCGCMDKETAVKRIAKEHGVDLKNVAYVGDDINDLNVIKLVGFSCCPADALPQIRKAAGYITESKGGEGVIREIVERWFQDM